MRCRGVERGVMRRNQAASLARALLCALLGALASSSAAAGPVLSGGPALPAEPGEQAPAGEPALSAEPGEPTPAGTPGEPTPAAEPAGEGYVMAEGEVVIIESRAPVGPATATAHTVDAGTIAATAKHSADDLLRLVPGLHISRHGGEGKAPQIFLRGFDAVHGSDVEVRVSGIPINEMSNVHGHGYVDIGFVIPEVVRALHARKGSFELDQGSFATAGSVDFELGVPAADRGTRMHYELGSTNRHRVLGVVAPENRGEATFAAVEAVNDAGFGENRSARRVSALGQHRIDLDSGRTVELMGAAYGAHFGEPGTVPVSALEHGDLDFYDTVVDGGTGSSYRALAGLRLHDERGSGRLEARAHLGWRALDLDENFTGFLLHPEMGDRRVQSHRSFSGGMRAGYEHDLSAALSLLAGAGVVADRIEQSEEQIDTMGVPWMEGPALEALQLTGDVHAGARLRPHARFRTEVGARLDTSLIAAEDLRSRATASDAATAISPRLTAALSLSPGWTLFGAYGRGLRVPEARAVLAAASPPMDEDAGSRSARIISTDAAELGVRGQLGRRVSMGLGGFGTWLGSEVLFDHVSGISLARQPSRRLGLELDLTYQPLEWLSLRSDVSAVDARFTDTDDPVPGAPRLLAALAAKATHASGFHGGAQLRYLAPRPLAHGAVGSATQVLDVNGGLRVGRYAMTLQIDNALGTRWREGEYHYASWFDTSQARSQLPRLHYTAGHPFGVRASFTAWF
jgi:iron complex outermembrane receptor protein